MVECLNYFWPWFSEAENERRYSLMRKGMEEKGLDCLLVYGVSRGMGMEPGQTNLVYLTSVASWSQTYLVFPLHEEPTMYIMSSNQVKNIRDNSVVKDVRPGGSFTRTGGLRDSAGPVAGRLKLELSQLLVGTLAVASASVDNIPYCKHHTGQVSITIDDDHPRLVFGDLAARRRYVYVNRGGKPAKVKG